MKRILFALILAIASGVWIMTQALCVARAPQAMPQTAETFQGVLFLTGAPCESDDDCPDCITLAFSADENMYYLTSDNPDMDSQLDELIWQIDEDKPATVTGIVFQEGSFSYINVISIYLGTQAIDNELVPNSGSFKIIRNNRLLILRGNQVYTLTGKEEK